MIWPGFHPEEQASRAGMCVFVVGASLCAEGRDARCGTAGQSGGRGLVQWVLVTFCTALEQQSQGEQRKGLCFSTVTFEDNSSTWRGRIYQWETVEGR